ncbi:MAG TPA: non-ribosomal peptide synthetase, partial [Pseudonocardiaceae bacterium]
TRLVAEHAAATPDATAVVDVATGERLTYGELDRRSAALAARLRAVGAGPDTLVALLMDRSPATVVAILAVLRTGAAYLPLDPEHPADRLAALLADAAPLTVLTTLALAPRLPTAPHVTVDTGSEAPAEPAADAEPEPDELAYVMFTSGSTGRPKGVMVPHGALANYAAADRAAHGLTAADRVLQFSPLTFDVSAEEIWPCLTAGAALVLRSDTMLDSPEEFLAMCGEHGVTVAHLPSAYFHELAPAAAAAPASLRVVAIGGEAANPARVAQWQELAPHARVVNVYGPTETTIVATMAELPPLRPADRTPIGRPVPGATAHVLDGELAPQPVGVVGEVYLGGAGLARGYLGDPAGTAHRFVPDPYGPPGSRLYRTGDRARLLEDGALDYAGRTDGQVKIRGYRVEPGEIEAALTELAAVREAAVVARPDAGGTHELVAYVVPAAGHAPDQDELRAELAGRLPAYLVPAAFVTLDALPLTANDKVDRAALPDPGPRGTAAFVAPEGEAQVAVAQVWREVLAVDRVGADDNFFTLGGHSLLAIQAISRLRRTYGPSVGLRQLFEHPTLAAFAAALPSREAAAGTGPAAPAPTRPPLLRAATGASTLAHLPAGADGDLGDLLRDLDQR